MCNQTPRHSSTKHINKQGTKNSKVEHWDYTTMQYLYHDSLLAGHEVVTRIYHTLEEKFYANNLFNSIKTYGQGCHTSHTRSAKESGYKSYHTGNPYDFRPMSRISAGIKWMPLMQSRFQLHFVCYMWDLKLCD